MIIYRAFIREVLQTCAAVTVILFSIFLVTRLVGFLSDAADGEIPINGVFILLILKMMTYLDVIVSLVLYISVLLVMGRWIRDNELVVINACGIGIGKFIRPALILFLIVGSLVASFSLYISPLSAEVAENILSKHKNRSDIAGIVPGVFTETPNRRGVYFVESYDTKTDNYRNIFVYDNARLEDDVVVASTGYKITDQKTNDDFLVLKNGAQYRGKAGSRSYTVSEFELYAVRLRQQLATVVTLPMKARTTLSLLEEQNHFAIGELQWRISKVTMLPILMLFALSFSSISYRKKRFPSMITALIIYFAYSNVLGLTMALIKKGQIHPYLSLWVVHLFFLIMAIYLFQRRSKNLRLIPGLKS